MNSLYNFSLRNKPLINIALIVIGSILLFTIISFLFQLAIYLLPIVLIGWGGYKLYNKARVFIKNYRNRNSVFDNEVEVMSSEEFVRAAEENNTVIDVEFIDIH
jgi:predicted membrane protein